MTESAKQGQRIVEGIFAIDKPQWATSAGALRDLKEHFNSSKLFAPLIERARRDLVQSGARPKLINKVQVKIGHGGTLDPLATGVLVVGVGRGTKALGSFLECTKDYDCVLLFGAATDTYDAVGKIVGKKSYAHVTRELVEKNLDQFRGDIMQKPSIFSALRVDGKKMYDYAREGGDIPELQARPVTVGKLELVDWYEPESHKYQWPNEEVDSIAKIGAENILGVRQVDVDAVIQRKKKHGRSESLEDNHPTAKRVKPLDGTANGNDTNHMPEATTAEDDGLVTNSDLHPRDPKSDDEPAMSGALPVQNSTSPNRATSPTASPNNATSEMPSPGPPAARFRMTVTSGFYVRSFCHDLGIACGSYGLMSSLVRTRQSDYSMGINVLSISDFQAGPEVWEPKVEAQLMDYMAKQGWDLVTLEEQKALEAKRKEEGEEDDGDRNHRRKQFQKQKYGKRRYQ